MEKTFLKSSYFKKAHTLKTGRDAVEDKLLLNSQGCLWIKETIPHWGYATYMWGLLSNSSRKI
jgi:hypothetical protein